MLPNRHPERVVIKIGTSSLISAGRPDPTKLTALTDAVVRLRAEDRQPVLIASGAIALGRAALDAGAARSAAAQQLAAAVGQGLLFEAFRQGLAERGLKAAQILLTPLDLTAPGHRASALAVLEGSLDAGLVPVVNENDAVMVRNNDVLAALLAAALRAGRLVLLTDVPGLYESDPRKNSGARRIPEVRVMTPDVERLAGIAAEGIGTGGMPAKLCAAWIATMAGVTTVIAGADTEDCVVRAVRGADLGTVVHPRVPDKQLDLGRLWRALSSPPSGRLVCHPTVWRSVADGGPLLAGQVSSAIGRFSAGDVVDVVVDDTRVVARGRVRISSAALAEAGADAMVSHHTEYIAFQEA
ncbi:glutamate 5-kinase [Streptomyces prunicolor]|uniref:Glutamate 5-kinase n=1 Tax=Streptomyces prunicolor TaxID=67348 RepID=A0ABU4FFJ5_9ACTN|nr:glutamate 5-kinase [Streptomyces prunicolor]MCX5243617.1 glutamate 5-kinase [Streptomyces prunicolor]MDV7219370.1 glutamate 5-kinase [Streptomyces prunicolor]